MQALTKVDANQVAEDVSVQQILTTTVGDQVFGIQVLSIQDILQPRTVAHVPKAPADVAGLINLRGRIVTVIDLRHWLGFEPAEVQEQMHIVIEHDNELYSFLVDSVGDVIAVDQSAVEGVPPNLPEQWRTISKNVLREDKDLILIIDVSVLIEALATN